MESSEKKGFSIAFLGVPLSVVLLMWASKWIELQYGSFAQYGIQPAVVKGLRGILFAPFIHGSALEHLLPNTFPVFILLVSLFYFYKKLAYPILFWAWIITGLWTWAIGGVGYHIGASGLIYALASFIFFSGLIRRYVPLMALSLLVVFIYGGLVWGVFPYKPNISWESHLSGAVTGLFLSWYYRNKGPAREPYAWENDDEETESPDTC